MAPRRLATPVQSLEGEKYLRFRFRAITGSGFQSDMAVDWFWVTDALPRIAGGEVPTEIGTDLATAENAAIVYPNPVGDQLNITLPEAVHGTVQLELMDLQGRSLIKTSMKATGSGLELPTHQLPRGTYLLRISAKGLQQSIRIARQ